VESCGFGYHSVPTTAEETAWTTASSKTGNDGEGPRPSPHGHFALRGLEDDDPPL
jgi:hypothetical protein